MIRTASALFPLSGGEAERLANRAGLSLAPERRTLPALLAACGAEGRRALTRWAVSERMLQYYAASREPTKAALLAIAIGLDVGRDGVEALLRGYGFALSRSLAGDAVTGWMLEHRPERGVALLREVNGQLEALGLPPLMTKEIRRKGETCCR